MRARLAPQRPGEGATVAHWDCDLFLDQPCACGAGRFSARSERENYPPFRTWVEACTACLQRYAVVAQAVDDVRLSV